MESFLGANFIINLNSFLGHINYVSYLYTRAIAKAANVSWMGRLHSQWHQGALEALERNSSSANRDGVGWDGHTFTLLPDPISSVRIFPVVLENAPSFPTVKPPFRLSWFLSLNFQELSIAWGPSCTGRENATWISSLGMVMAAGLLVRP